MVTLQAKNLTLNEVHQLRDLQPSVQRVRFTDVLNLPDLTEWEMTEMEQIRIDFQAYWQAGKVLEGQVQLLVLAPLLRLAGYYRSPIQLSLEQAIAEQFPVSHIIRLPGLFGVGLKKNVIFDLLNLNQLEKIQGHSQFQWYGLSRLWADMQVILENDLRLIVMATEPVPTQMIQTRFFPDLTIGADASAPVFYDIHTRHAHLFGGNSGYILSQAQVLDSIEQFVKQERNPLT